jgi:hypothetical protein
MPQIQDVSKTNAAKKNQSTQNSSKGSLTPFAKNTNPVTLCRSYAMQMKELAMPQNKTRKLSQANTSQYQRNA